MFGTFIRVINLNHRRTIANDFTSAYMYRICIHTQTWVCVSEISRWVVRERYLQFPTHQLTRKIHVKEKCFVIIWTSVVGFWSYDWWAWILCALVIWDQNCIYTINVFIYMYFCTWMCLCVHRITLIRCLSLNENSFLGC